MELRSLTDEDAVSIEGYGTMSASRPRQDVSLSPISDDTSHILTDDKLAVS